jgi:thiol-disulfide isomerase/thioredoxin
MVGRRALITGVFTGAIMPMSGCGRGGDDVAVTCGQAGTGAGTVGAFVGDDHAPVPAVSGELLDGSTFDLGSLRGGVIVINVWGSWYVPCRAEAPDLEATYQGHQGSGRSFPGSGHPRRPRRGTAFIASFGLTYPSLFDPAGRVVLAFRDESPNVVPATILIDRQYRGAAVFRKTVARRELETALRALATEETP